jgi:hypothetical protein
MGDLRLASTKLAVDFGDRLGFDPTAEQLVDLVDLPGELADVVAAFEDRRAGLEAADVGGLAGGIDNVRGGARPDIRRVRELAGGGNRNRLIVFVARFDQFVRRGRSDSWKGFEIVVCHCTPTLLGFVHKPSLTAE